MNYERKEILNALVDYYSISFTEAEKFLKKFPTFAEVQDVIKDRIKEPVDMTFNSNIYGDGELDKLLATWKDQVLRTVKDFSDNGR